MANDPTIGRLIQLVNKHSVDLTRALRENEELRRRVDALEREAPREVRNVEVTSFPGPPAIDPILLTESDGDFEDVQEEA